MVFQMSLLQLQIFNFFESEWFRNMLRFRFYIPYLVPCTRYLIVSSYEWLVASSKQEPFTVHMQQLKTHKKLEIFFDDSLFRHFSNISQKLYQKSTLNIVSRINIKSIIIIIIINFMLKCVLSNESKYHLSPRPPFVNRFRILAKIV